MFKIQGDFNVTYKRKNKKEKRSYYKVHFNYEVDI